MCRFKKSEIVNAKFLSEVKMTSSLRAEAKHKGRTTKAIREVDSNGEYYADYGGQDLTDLKEGYKGQPRKTKTSKPSKEIGIVNRLLPKFNTFHNGNYSIDENKQPKQADSADVIIRDPNTGKVVKIQVRESDDEHQYPISTGKFSRAGNSYDIASKAIRRAIQDKIDKNYADKSNLVIALGGWKSVRKEELVKFSTNESNFLEKAGFKEIWFVGQEDETIVKLC